MLRKIALAIVLALPLGTMATAQDTAPDYDWRAVIGQSVKVQMKINAEFEVSKERVVPVHFTMGVPFSKGKLLTRTRFPKQTGNLGEMQFLSLDKTLLEYVTILVGKVDAETADERLKRLFALIDEQVYPSLTPPPTAKILGGRITKIAGHPAVEFVSLFTHPEQGPVAARIVGVIAPNQTDVVIFVQQTMRDEMGLAGPDELAKTFAGVMLSSLTFQAYRDASGVLVGF
ncbi:hypothetical protein IMCC20628_02637 [Hoeflea sp. IMCC20628]|uniref:hypothetical protein n=1 Tax=Hoeflea sp. IMCC20628 TaxID=1620421 RepID=UPI00063AF47C|nr:hypothetical protein [Hoeflea sp. IMCC20628]AKI01334.1 hypothetical protein IMCC20628_02637 [Hoeflea sp. IMCC20628]